MVIQNIVQKMDTQIMIHKSTQTTFVEIFQSVHLCSVYKYTCAHLLLSLSLPSLLLPLPQSPPPPMSSQLANDTARKNKSLAQQVKEINSLYEDELHNREEQHQLATKAEKRANELALEVEEIRAQMEQVCGVRVCVCVRV